MNYALLKPCPYCGEKISHNKLVKKPNTFFTFQQTTHCPYCDGEVKADVLNVKLFFLAIVWLVMIVALSYAKRYYEINDNLETILSIMINFFLIFSLFKFAEKAPFIKS